MLGEGLHRLVDAIGRHDRLRQSPEVFAGHQFWRPEGQPSDGDLSGSCCGLNPFGMVRRRIVPHEELGHVWAHLAKRVHECQAVIWRLRSRMRVTSSPVAALSAPCTTRRLLRPLTTTTACSPRCAQAERSGGNSRSVVSTPNQTSPPAATIAAACCATVFFLGIRRIGTSQDELGPLPSPAQTMDRPADGRETGAIPLGR